MVAQDTRTFEGLSAPALTTMWISMYLDVSLAKTRARRDEDRKLLADSIDPGVARKAKTAARQDSVANRFEIIARE